MPDGETGEILVRPGIAFGCMAGYVDSPELTLDAWCNKVQRAWLRKQRAEGAVDLEA